MMRARDPRFVDAAAAAVFLAACVVDVLTNQWREGPAWANVAGSVAIAALLLTRRRAPVASSLAYFAVLLAFAAWLSPPGELVMPLLAVLFFAYATANHATPRDGVLVLAGLVLTATAANAGIVAVALGLAAYIVGRAVRSRLELAAQLHEAALHAQEEDEAEAARAVLDERRRIAREMHDVVAHSISVMVVQAGGARRILERDPARAMQAGAEIERVGRDALVEMRRLLGALHPREDGPPMAPQPGMADLPALLERSRAAGLPVALLEEGDPRELAPGMDLALYRILQEALTNALEHSGRAPTEVRLSWSDDRVELAVTDDGPRADGDVDDGPGLIGMRERVRLYGGELACSRRPEGGFRVHARIPFGQEEPD